MNDIASTILEYENSYKTIVNRIQAISDTMRDIKKQASGRYQDDSTYVKLSYKRDNLRDMLNDVEYALKQMREYQTAILLRSESERTDDK